MNLVLKTEDLWKLIVQLYLTSTFTVRCAYIFWIAFIAMYAAIGWYERFHSIRPKRKVKRHNYHGTLYIFGGVAAIIHHFSLHAGWAFYAPMCESGNSVALAVLGFVSMTVGLYLAFAGRVAIDGQWGIHIFDYHDKGKLVTRGIYQHCRHPIYAGQVAMAIGSVCLANNWWTSVFPLGTAVLSIWRAYREEHDLLVRFPAEFPEYRNVTPFIIPWVAGRQDDAE